MAATKPIILYNNYAETYGINSVTTEDSSYPKENLVDWRYYTQYKGTSTATHNIVIDMGATLGTAPNYLVMANHNMGTAGATVTVQHDDNAGFTSPTSVGNASPSTDNPFAISLTAGVERYWRIQITSLGANPEIGMLFLGPQYQMPVLPQDGYDVDMQQVSMRVNQSLGGHHLGSVLNATDRVIRASFRYLTEAQAATYRDFWEDHFSKGKPVFYMPDNTNYSSRIYILRAPDNPQLAMVSQGTYRHVNFEGVGLRNVAWS